MTKRFDVAVIGAGIVGLSAARALAAAGRRVVMLDRGRPAGEASAAAAGMLAPQVEAQAGGALLPLGLAARERHVALAAECAAAGFDIGHYDGGIVHLAFDEARERGLRQHVEAQRVLGLEASWLDRAALRRRHPGVAPGARGALLAPRDGCVNNVALGAALLVLAQRAGAVLVTDEVCEVRSRGGRVAGLRAAGSDYDADVVVLAAGAWAGTIAGLPRAVPVEPVRGQLAALPWPPGEPPAVLYSDGGYIVWRGDEAIVGSTMEHTGFEKGTTTEGLARILSAATALLPALPTLPLRSWSGLRPMTPDGLPILGADPGMDGLFYATGHGRNGILLGPLSGDIIGDLVVRGDTRWDIAPYGIARFQR